MTGTAKAPSAATAQIAEQGAPAAAAPEPADEVDELPPTDPRAVAATLERTVVSLLTAGEVHVIGYGCRTIARMAIEGKRKRMLQCGGTQAARSMGWVGHM